MAAAFVQAVTPASNDADLGTIAVSFSSNLTAGNLVFVAVSHGGAAAGWAVTDTLGNTYTQIRNTRDATNNQDITTFYAKNVTGGACTITASLSPTTRTFRRMTAAEYSGLDTTAPLDVEIGQQQGTGSSSTDGVTSTAATTTASGDMIVGAVMDTGGVATIAAGTNFTERTDLGGLELEDRVQSSSGSIAATWTFSAANAYVATMAAFKVTGGGGTSRTVTATVASSTAAVVAPPKPRPANPFSEINVRM